MDTILLKCGFGDISLDAIEIVISLQMALNHIAILTNTYKLILHP